MDAIQNKIGAWELRIKTLEGKAYGSDGRVYVGKLTIAEQAEYAKAKEVLKVLYELRGEYALIPPQSLLVDKFKHRLEARQLTIDKLRKELSEQERIQSCDSLSLEFLVKNCDDGCKKN